MKLLNNLKIKNKLMVCFAINIFFMILIAVISYQGLSRIEKNIEDIFLVRLPAVDFLLEADRDLHQALVAERTLLVIESESIHRKELVEAFMVNKEQTKQRFEKYADLVSSSEERRLIPEFQEAYSNWETSALSVVNSAAEDSEYARELSMGRANEEFEYMRNFIDQATELNLTDAEKAHTNSVEVFRSVMGLLGVVVLVSIVIAVYLAWSVARSITKPLSEAIDGLKDVAQGQGDLTKRLNVSSTDEVGDLTNWFNVFIENLQGIIQQIAENTVSTSHASEHLLQLAERTSSDASQLAERSNSVSSSSDEMSSSISAVAAAVEEYSTNINVVATAAEQMNASVMEISKSTSKANEMTSSSVSEANITSEKMKQLESAAKEITNVTEVINAISAQTNLLALNATIEAASAGEAGKGFAVVANEIKELARQTSDATGQIQTQIDNIQTSCRLAIEQISNITEIIGDVDSVVTTIAAAVEEQSVTTREISANITQASDSILEVSSSVSLGSESSSSIAREMNGVNSLVESVNEMSKDISTSADDLQRSSNGLQKLVTRFKVA